VWPRCAATQSIATSTAQNDSGLFELNFRDERYLPFEGAGVISTWQIAMPQETNAFEFETISDVIFNFKYSARDGGASLRSTALQAAVLPPGSPATAAAGVATAIPNQANLVRLFSLRHEFPTEWYNFLHPLSSSPDLSMTIGLTQERFPFLYRAKKIQIYQMDFLLKFTDIHDSATFTSPEGTPLGDYLAKGPGGVLILNLTAPAGASQPVKLSGNTLMLNGVPVGTVPQPPPKPALQFHHPSVRSEPGHWLPKT